MCTTKNKIDNGNINLIPHFKAQRNDAEKAHTKYNINPYIYIYANGLKTTDKTKPNNNHTTKKNGIKCLNPIADLSI